MDSSFNFFKTKVKIENEKSRSKTKSNYSPYSQTKQNPHTQQSTQRQQSLQKQLTITKKQLQIREAIAYRFQKSKMRNYMFERLVQVDRKSKLSSHSSDEQQYRNLKNLKVVDLKQYQRDDVSSSKQSSLDKKKLNLRFKTKDANIENHNKIKNMGTITKTDSTDSINRSFYINRGNKNQKHQDGKKQDWRSTSIRLREGIVGLASSKEGNPSYKDKKNMGVISQRAITEEKNKVKSNSAMSMHSNKVPRLHQLSKLNRTKF